MAQARYRMDDEDAALRTWEAILALDDDVGLVGRCDVESWAELLAERLRREDLRELRRRTLLAEPPAHSGQV
jgi:hypothetical protein